MEKEVWQASDILFCEKGGYLTCCFSNIKCVEDHEYGEDYHDKNIFSWDCLRENEVTKLGAVQILRKHILVYGRT